MARGGSLLKSGTIPYSEQIIYKQCLKYANTPVKLAKCVTQLLDIQENLTYHQQKDSPSAIEKLGELFFGSKFPSKTTTINLEEVKEEPLKRVIPIPIKPFEVMQKFNDQDLSKPIAVRERYYANDDINGKTDFHPIVRSKVFRLPQQRNIPVPRPQNRKYYQTNARRRRWKRELQKQRIQKSL
uniref:Uncharacterized protein n=1 Tax=Panagrolaimus davidi TaxID=227884 RepID=A0A914PJJ3_9BILA